MSQHDEYYSDETDVEELEPFYGNVVEFVEQWLLPHYKRDPKTHYWDARWWEHTEAVGRLEALWRAWEHFRLDGMTGMAVFFRDYMDPTMSVLTSERGPFWNKKNIGERTIPHAWPAETPDEEFYRMGA